MKFSFSHIFRGKRYAAGMYLEKAKKHGFFHILGGSTLVKAISVLSVLLFPRVMGKGDYTIFKNADMFFGYLLVVNGFGMANVVLRYCAMFDDPREQKSYYSYAVRFGTFANFFLIAIYLGIIYIPTFFGWHTLNFGTENYLALMLCLAFFEFFFTSSQNLLRTEMRNKEYARNSVIFSLLYALIPLAFALVLRFFSYTVEGAIFGRYIAYAITALFVLKCIKTLPCFKFKARHLTRAEKNSVLKYAVNTLIASGFSTIMPYNENTVINHMVTKDALGDFSTAQIVPMSVQFIAMSIVVFVFPYFAKNYKDGAWIFKKTKHTVLLMSAAMFGIAAVGIVLAPYITLVFGKEFKTPDCIRLMRVFFITFAVNGAIRIPIGNILAAIGEVKFNVYNAIFSCTVHIAICWAMTSAYGINGAAYGLLIGYVISSAASLIYLRYYCRKLERIKRSEPELPDN